MAGLCLNININGVFNASNSGEAPYSANGTPASGYGGNWNKKSNEGNPLSKWDNEFKLAGEKLNLDWRLVAAHAYIESGWNEKALNPSSAGGLYQFIAKYWHGSAPKGYEDPKWRLDGHIATQGYINLMTRNLNRFKNAASRNDQIMLAMQQFHDGYISGTTWANREGNKYSGTAESKKYVPKILKKYADFGGSLS